MTKNRYEHKRDPLAIGTDDDRILAYWTHMLKWCAYKRRDPATPRYYAFTRPGYRLDRYPAQMVVWCAREEFGDEVADRLQYEFTMILYPSENRQRHKGWEDTKLPVDAWGMYDGRCVTCHKKESIQWWSGMCHKCAVLRDSIDNKAYVLARDIVKNSKGYYEDEYRTINAGVPIRLSRPTDFGKGTSY